MRGNFGDKNKNKNKTMCNNHSGSVHHHPVKCVLDDALRFSVECACRFIEKEDLGILDNGTGDRDASNYQTEELKKKKMMRGGRKTTGKAISDRTVPSI
uniref:Uncharacterized protein n=1 Tax=Leersia perrieri TaxID=77586 RepID=A0A0D9WCG8_9ORYZ